MLRQSQLPPRAPFQRKPACQTLDECNPLNPTGWSESSSRYHKPLFLSSSSPEDRPAWLDDLLSDMNSSSRAVFHCRSSSDSAALLDDFTARVIPSSANDDESSASDESGNALERDCVYGPNSPRRRVNREFSGNSMLSVLSGYASQLSIPHAEEIDWSSGPEQFGLKGEECAATKDSNGESTTTKRHPRQRSRARKLQYIAELERAVHALQGLEAELSFKVSGLAQQRVKLSVENSNLKQQMGMLRHRKLVLDGEYQLLRKEAEKLKLGLASIYGESDEIHPRPGYIDAADSDWHTLDWVKLNLG